MYSYLVYTEELAEQLKKFSVSWNLTSAWERYAESHIININKKGSWITGAEGWSQGLVFCQAVRVNFQTVEVKEKLGKQSFLFLFSPFSWNTQMISVREAKAIPRPDDIEWRNKYICVEGRFPLTTYLPSNYHHCINSNFYFC